MILSDEERQVFLEGAKDFSEIVELEAAEERAVRWLPHESKMMTIFDKYGPRLSAVRCRGSVFIPYRPWWDDQAVVPLHESTVEEIEPDERRAFVEAAPAFAQAIEPIELILQQEKAGQLIDKARIDALRAQAAIPAKVVARIFSNHPDLSAIRFRAWIFLPHKESGEIVRINVISESTVETIEG